MLSLRVSAWGVIGCQLCSQSLAELVGVRSTRNSAPFPALLSSQALDEAFPSLALDAARVGHHHSDRPGVDPNSLHSQSLPIQHHDNFPILCGYCNLLFSTDAALSPDRPCNDVKFFALLHQFST